MSTCVNCGLQAMDFKKSCPNCNFNHTLYSPDPFALIIQIPPLNINETCNPNCRLYYLEPINNGPSCGGKFGIESWANDRRCERIMYPGPGCPREDKSQMNQIKSKPSKSLEDKDRKSCSEVCKVDCYNEQGNIQICAKKSGWKQPGPNCPHGR